MLARADSFLFNDPSVVPGARRSEDTRSPDQIAASPDTRSPDQIDASPVVSRRSVVMDYLDHFEDLERRKALPTVMAHSFVRPLTYVFRGMRAGKRVGLKIQQFSRAYQRKHPRGGESVVPVVSEFMQKLMNDFRIPALMNDSLR